jgi:hypothetical protein
MSTLTSEIERFAAMAVEMSRESPRPVLDYSEASVPVLEEMAGEAAGHRGELNDDQRHGLVRAFGCYLLEVARRTYGGAYQWHEASSQPVLVFGEPACHIALFAWDRVAARIAGGPADSVALHYDEFAAHARSPEPGERLLLA